MDYEKDIAIDKSNLSDELVEQPQRYYDWAKEAVNAGIETARAKDYVDVVRAEVELRIRKHPNLFDLPDKPTEAMVKAAVTCDRKVKRAQRNYLRALKAERLLAKAERSFEHRKKSLEGLVTMDARLWFSQPRVGDHAQQQVDQDSLLRSARKRSGRRIGRRKRK